MNIFDQIMTSLEYVANHISLELFVIVGSFLEEIVAPIPSPFVMTTAAFLANEQNYSLLQLTILITIGAVAKTLSTYVVYVVADKAEDFVIGKLGKKIGLDHKHVEKIGGFLRGTWWDDVLLFIARAVPLIPTFPISVAAGVIKYNVRSYLIITFIGSIIRNIFYLWIGYFGYTQLEHLWVYIQDQPILIGLLVVAIVVAIIAAMKLKDYVYETALDKAEQRNKANDSKK